MKHELPELQWGHALVQELREAKPGDSIAVSMDQKETAEKALLLELSFAIRAYKSSLVDLKKIIKAAPCVKRGPFDLRMFD